MKKKTKNVEVSAKSRFGQTSQMDREIEKWTKQGWILTNTISARGDKYLLTFEYIPSEKELERERKQSRNSTILLVIFIGICGISYFINSSISLQNAPITQTAQAVAQGIQRATASQEAYERPTQAARSTETSIAIATLTTFTPTPRPSATPLPSNTPRPTRAPQGMRENPYQGIGTVRDGRFQVNSIQRNMSDEVERMNMFNSEPDPGEEWVVADVTFFCDLSSNRTCNTSAIFFEMVGKNGTIYQVERLAVIENAFGGEIFGGGQVTGNVGYIVDSSDGDFLVVINDLGDRTYFSVP